MQEPDNLEKRKQDLDEIIANAQRQKEEIAKLELKKAHEEVGDKLRKDRDDLKEFRDLMIEKAVELENCQMDMKMRFEIKMIDGILSNKVTDYFKGTQLNHEPMIKLLDRDLEVFDKKIKRHEDPTIEEREERKRKGRIFDLAVCVVYGAFPALIAIFGFILATQDFHCWVNDLNDLAYRTE